MLWKVNLTESNTPKAALDSFSKLGHMSFLCSSGKHPYSTCNVRKRDGEQSIKLNGLLETRRESCTNDVWWKVS